MIHLYIRHIISKYICKRCLFFFSAIRCMCILAVSRWCSNKSTSLCALRWFIIDFVLFCCCCCIIVVVAVLLGSMYPKRVQFLTFITWLRRWCTQIRTGNLYEITKRNKKIEELSACKRRTMWSSSKDHH